MESENEFAPNGNGGGWQFMPNQLGWRRRVQATNAAKPVSQIEDLIKNAQENAGGFVHSALNNLPEAVSRIAHIAAKHKLLYGFIVCSMIIGAFAHNSDGHPDGSCEVKPFPKFREILPTTTTTDVKVAMGTILAILGSVVIIAAWWVHSRRPAFTEADIMDGLAMGPAVARRSNPTFEIHPSI